MDENSVETPTVSIVMNCLNCADYLEAALASVRAQTFTDWEIIFYDNASTDDSARIAHRFDDTRLRYVKSPETVILGVARNQALKLARGQYITFLDCDDLWRPDKLEKQIPLFEADPQVGMVFSDTVEYYQHDGTSITHFADKGRQPERGRIFPDQLSCYTIAMSSVVLSSRVLESEAHWFDVDLSYATDYDLFMRIAYAWKCDLVNEPLSLYRVHGVSTTERQLTKIPWELEYIQNKFRELIPGFDQKFSEQIANRNRLISYIQAKVHWSQEKKGEARLEFARYLSGMPLYMAYLATLFPYGMMRRFWNLAKSFKRKRTDVSLSGFELNGR